MKIMKRIATLPVVSIISVLMLVFLTIITPALWVFRGTKIEEVLDKLWDRVKVFILARPMDIIEKWVDK